MAKKYLDDAGVLYFWGKLKEYFQVKLVSGTNIKTINSQSVLGSGNITISGGASVLDFYPIGSYYETSDTAFNPNTAWGGTWVLEAEGKAHVSAGTSYIAGTEYGTNTHTHTTGAHKLVESEIPAHTHGSKTVSGKFRIRKVGNNAAMVTASTNFTVSDYSGTGTGASAGSTSYKMSEVEFEQAHTHTSYGGSGTHSHGDTGSTTRNSWQPSIAVNRWHRTA